MHDLAKYLDVEIVAADKLVKRSDLEELESIQPGVFSAVTFHLANSRTVIAYNPCNEIGRTSSDVAHELAHILLDHDVRELQQVAGHIFFTCDPVQEEEANWLAGCLLLPRPLLLREMYDGADAAAIADKYSVSLPMAKFRINTSGVLLQIRRARGRR